MAGRVCIAFGMCITLAGLSRLHFAPTPLVHERLERTQ